MSVAAATAALEGAVVGASSVFVAAVAAEPSATYVIASDLGPSLIEPLGSKDRTSFISMELGEVLDRYLAREQGLGIDRLRSYDMTRFKDD